MAKPRRPRGFFSPDSSKFKRTDRGHVVQRPFKPAKNWAYNWQTHWTNRTLLNGQVISSTPGISVQWSESLSRVAADNPDWRRRIRVEPVLTGELHATYFTRRQMSEPSYVIAWTDLTGAKNNHQIDGVFSLAPPSVGGISPITVSTAQNAAISNFLKRYHAATRQVQGLQQVAEIKQIIETIIHPYNILGTLTSNLIHNNARARRRYLRGQLTYKQLTKTAANEWLQFRFGVMPVIQDINDAAEFYGRWNGQKRDHLVITGRGEGRDANPPIVLEQTIGGGTLIILRHTRKLSQKVDVKLRGAINVSYGRGPDFIISNMERFGFSIRNLPGTLWEETPWSFLVDYFLNVQEIIDAWSFGSVFGDGLQMTTVRTLLGQTGGIVFDTRNCPSTISVSASVNGAEIIELSKQVDRVKLLTLPLPSLQVSTGLSFNRWANIISLSRLNAMSLVPNQLRRRPIKIGPSVFNLP